MKDIGHNENIPADSSPTPTPEKPQLAPGCPVPVYNLLAKTYNCDTDSGNDSSDSDNDRAEANKNYVISICMTV